MDRGSAHPKGEEMITRYEVSRSAVSASDTSVSLVKTPCHFSCLGDH